MIGNAFLFWSGTYHHKLMSFALACQSNKACNGKMSTPSKHFSYGHINSAEANDHVHLSTHLQRATSNNKIQRRAKLNDRFDFSRIGIQPKLELSQPTDPYEQEADRVAVQITKTSGEDNPSSLFGVNNDKENPAGKCTACKISEEDDEEKQWIRISRKPAEVTSFQITDEMADEIRNIRSGGTSLDARTKGLMEANFGYDFGNVRIHTDERAAKSAHLVNALAYTVGSDIVFGEGQYAPKTSEGRRLLAHELTHVVQQGMAGYSGASAAMPVEQKAGETGAEIRANVTTRVHAPVESGTIQRQPAKPIPKSLDADAENIVSVIMPNPKDRRDKQTKAVELVYRILNKYFPGYASKVSGVGFDNKKAGDGLMVHQIMKPNMPIYGFIYVGDTFVDELVNDKFTFASHVAKVAHELEHIDQWRSGMVGAGKKDEREFLAHYHESVFIEKPGTGGIYHSTRARHLDAALGLYYCLESDLQKKYEETKKELLALRPKEVKYGHKDKYPNPPTTCKKPEEFGFSKTGMP
jgi:hypothetical protein